MNTAPSVKAKRVITLAAAVKFALGLQKSTAKLGLLVLLLAASGLATVRVHGQPTIPTTFSLPSAAADTSKPGFVWRSHQVAAGQVNDNARTEAQLAGLLGDNIADPNAQGIAIAPASPPNPSTAPIAFNIGSVINLSAEPFDIYNGNFVPDDQMPGIPGTTGSYDNVAADVLTWLDLPAGTITMGVNSDDGFRMTLGGANPNDQFAVKVGEFNGGRGAADTIFSFTITQAGLYAARCTWEQGIGGANIEIFSVQSDGTRVLVNDTANGGIPAYRAATSPPRAYARKVSPAPGAGARPDVQIIVELVDGASPIDPAKIKLSVDGTQVAVVRSKTGSVTTTTYNPPSFYALGSHNVAFTYSEGALPVTVNWTFVVLNYQGPNGNLYEFVPADNIPWADAKIAAEQRTFGCAHGHLATLTSAEEDVFVELLRQQYVQTGALAQGEVWAGGFQLPNQPTTYDGWFWVNNEGPIAGQNGGSTYANWNQPTSEPNDCCNTYLFEDNEENFLGIGYFGPGAGWIDDDVSHFNIVGYVVEYERLGVAIDIKPGTSPNPIYLDASGKLPVAILSSASFNANTVDPATVKFGRTGTEASLLSYTLEDVNKDGRKDLVCQFNIQDTGLMCGDTAAQLQASTFAGCPLKGSDSVQILSCPPYALSIQSLLDVHHLTDVYLKVTPILQGHTAPTVSQSILLKSFDIFGNLRWAKTLQNVALTPNPDQSTSVDLQYTDMEHGQNVKAKMLVKDSVSGVTEVLTQQGRVLFRPDLAVDSVTAPSQANLRQIVNIFASISELKGDLGATANVYLLDGDNVIDVMNEISLSPLGNIGVAFSTVFSTEGIHQLKVAIRDETPGDYDLSNNEKSFSIQAIKPPLEPVFYCASYSHYEQDYQSVVENPYWISTYHVQYTNEYTYQTLYIPVALQSLQKVTLKIAGDGVEQDNLEALNIPLYGFSDGCYSSFSGSQYLGDSVYFYIQTYQDCYGNQSSYAQFNKYASSQLYFSSFYYKLWGIGYTNSSSFAYGTPLNAVNSVTTRFIVEGDAGAFGGNGNVGFLYNYPFDYAWDYYEYDYSDGLYDEHVTGFSRGKSVYGSTCDITTP